jgi:hypothetical protein
MVLEAASSKQAKRDLADIATQGLFSQLKGDYGDKAGDFSFVTDEKGRFCLVGEPDHTQLLPLQLLRVNRDEQDGHINELCVASPGPDVAGPFMMMRFVQNGTDRRWELQIQHFLSGTLHGTCRKK